MKQIEPGGERDDSVATLSDVCRLLQMNEIEREELLAARQEELQRLQDKHNLDHMLKAQSGNADSEHVSQAAKREWFVLCPLVAIDTSI